MRGELTVRRRPSRPTPMSTRRLAFGAGAPALPSGAFPGFVESDGDGRRSRWLSGSLAVLVHGSLLAGLLLYAWLNPAIIETVIPVQLLPEEAPKPKPQPVAKVEPKPAPPAAPAPTPAPPKQTPAPVPKEDPAPAPKALAERRTPTFAPQAQAMAPQVVNPSVIAKAAPAIDARKLEGVGAATAPREIAHPTSVASVSPIPSIAPAQASKIDLGGASAPALRGPIEAAAPVGQSAGPRQVVTSGGTVGTGTEVANLGGSSVREGIVTGRDVLGSPNGSAVASINTRVGEGNMRGDGGSGTGQGGGGSGGCDQGQWDAYVQGPVYRRLFDRWNRPADAPTNVPVKIEFTLDAAGSLLSSRVVSSGDAQLEQSALEAMRSAAPFPPIPEAARCMAGKKVTGTFRLAAGN